MMPAVHQVSQLLVWAQDPQVVNSMPPMQARAIELGWENIKILGGVLAAISALVVVLYTTRTGVIARAAAKEAIRQPVFPLLLVVALVMLVFNTFIPFFSLGEDVKMMEVCGLAMLLICGMFLAIWTSSMSISDEIEGKTAMTMLSKPVNRRQFILGKFLGIQTAVLLMALPIVIAFAGLTIYKVFYDARESTRDDVMIENAVVEVLRLMPAVVLVFDHFLLLLTIQVVMAQTHHSRQSLLLVEVVVEVATL